MRTIYTAIASRLKPRRKLLSWLAIGLVGYWAFSYYVFIPVCMHPSKPLTMYFESNPAMQSEGAPKRVTFRVPSAYLIRPAYAPRLIGGKQESININLNIRNSEPMCLSEFSKFNDNRPLITIHLSGIGTKNRFNNFMNSQLPMNSKSTKTENGFLSYRYPGSVDEYMVPTKQYVNPVYFECVAKDYQFYREGGSGCSAHTTYRNLHVEYIFRRTDLQQWNKIEPKLSSFLDALIVEAKE